MERKRFHFPQLACWARQQLRSSVVTALWSPFGPGNCLRRKKPKWSNGSLLSVGGAFVRTVAGTDENAEN